MGGSQSGAVWLRVFFMLARGVKKGNDPNDPKVAGATGGGGAYAPAPLPQVLLPGTAIVRTALCPGCPRMGGQNTSSLQ